MNRLERLLRKTLVNVRPLWYDVINLEKGNNMNFYGAVFFNGKGFRTETIEAASLESATDHAAMIATMLDKYGWKLAGIIDTSV